MSEPPNSLNELDGPPGSPVSDGSQLELEGMPRPNATPPPSQDALRIDALLDDPDATVEDLLSAFRVPGGDARKRDACLLHPSISRIDLVATITNWPEAVRDRALSVTDDISALSHWARSPSPFDRAIVAMNPRCPSELAIDLARDPHAGVRLNALCCPQLPKAMRTAMANRDPDPDVREFAHWLITTITGRDIIDGHRYATVSGRDDQNAVRVITYGISREPIAPA